MNYKLHIHLLVFIHIFENNWNIYYIAYFNYYIMCFFHSFFVLFMILFHSTVKIKYGFYNMMKRIIENNFEKYFAMHLKLEYFLYYISRKFLYFQKNDLDRKLKNKSTWIHSGEDQNSRIQEIYEELIITK